ncbi:MAG: urease accessory protein UreD [Rhodospirillales bacterium]|nr:urease accessory protein UreD [Rhodospirillales bacterium]
MSVVISPSDPGISSRAGPASARSGATHGIADLRFRADAGTTRLAGLDQRAPLRALFPASADDGLANAVLVTTTGGLVGGDRLDVRVIAGAGANVLVTAQAAEKVYRSLGADCRVSIDLNAAEASWLEWLPQETILFEAARLERTTRIDAAAGARVLAGDILVFGRRARGETLTQGRFRDAWQVHRAGRLVWADALAGAGDLAAVLAAPACLAGAAAIATAIYLADDAAKLVTIVRDLTGEADGGEMAVAVTCIAGVLIVRWLSRDARVLRSAFGRFWATFRRQVGGWTCALPRVWCV